jgi:hypothetical protein
VAAGTRLVLVLSWWLVRGRHHGHLAPHRERSKLYTFRPPAQPKAEHAKPALDGAGIPLNVNTTIVLLLVDRSFGWFERIAALAAAVVWRRHVRCDLNPYLPWGVLTHSLTAPAVCGAALSRSGVPAVLGAVRRVVAADHCRPAVSRVQRGPAGRLGSQHS